MSGIQRVVVVLFVVALAVVLMSLTVSTGGSLTSAAPLSRRKRREAATPQGGAARSLADTHRRNPLHAAHSPGRGSTPIPAVAAAPTEQRQQQTSAPPPTPQHKIPVIEDKSEVQLPLCKSLRVPKGNWVETFPSGWNGTSTVAGFEPFKDLPSTWNPGHYKTNCRYRTFSKEEARACVANKTILVSGESLVRDVLTQLLVELFPEVPSMWKGKSATGRHHMDGSTKSVATGTFFYMLWNPVPRLATFNVYNVEDGYKKVVPDHILLGASLWDVKSSEGPITPKAHHIQQVRMLKEIREQWPNTPILYYMLTQITKPDPCFTRKRVDAVRSAVECALVDANAGISVFDFFHPSDDGVARKNHYVPAEGVHPQGTLKQWAVQMWLNGLCGTVKGAEPTCDSRDAYQDMDACTFP